MNTNNISLLMGYMGHQINIKGIVRPDGIMHIWELSKF
jgi:hypothetical protein